MSFLREYEKKKVDKGHDMYIVGTPYRVDVPNSLLYIQDEQENRLKIKFDTEGKILYIKSFLTQKCQLRVVAHFKEYQENTIDQSREITLLDIETIEEVNRRIRKKEQEDREAQEKRYKRKSYHTNKHH